MVILENFEPAPALCHVVFAFGSPADHRFFVAPGRMGQHPARPKLALKALVVDEAVDFLQARLQMLGELEIVLFAAFVRMNFKDHREHRLFLSGGSGGDRCDIAGRARN